MMEFQGNSFIKEISAACQFLTSASSQVKVLSLRYNIENLHMKSVLCHFSGVSKSVRMVELISSNLRTTEKCNLLTQRLFFDEKVF